MEYYVAVRKSTLAAYALHRKVFETYQDACVFARNYPGRHMILLEAGPDLLTGPVKSDYIKGEQG